jgi:hypothetical protein
MDYVEMYYSQVHGCYPFDTDNNKIKSKKIIDYLHDAGISENDIMEFVEHAPASDYLTPGMLPESLWKGSLLEKGKFYYHRTLHIVSKPPVWDHIAKKEIVYPFFMEMRIRYSMDDLLDYYYGLFKVEQLMKDKKRDGAAFKYLLERYKKISFIEPIDYVLMMTDFVSESSKTGQCTIRSPLDLNSYESDIYTLLDNMTKDASFQGVNKIVWR